MGFIKKILFSLLVAVLCLIFLEGGAGVVLTAKAMWDRRQIKEAAHTRHDDTLGWVALPNVDIKDIYQEGRDLRTNSQGFRSDHDFSLKVPEGKIRVVCSGDSFTLGYGVNNADTWCQRLEVMDPRLETINMGQGGYGIDQSYLWFMRDGTDLQPNIHILAFIREDINRMMLDQFLGGYGKPTLELKDGKLEVRHVPVKKTREWIKPLFVKGVELKKSAFVRLMEKALKCLNITQARPADYESIKPVLLKVIDQLAAESRSYHGKFVFVFLPQIDDYFSMESDALRRWLKREMKSRGVLFIDLFNDTALLSEYEKTTYERLGHFSEDVNQFVAERIYFHLVNAGLVTP